jgi:signal transduction histidine kinase
MRSMRARLFALWLMLAVSAGVTGFVLLEFYRQSANAQVARAEETVTRSCRDIGDRFSFVIAGWRGAPEKVDDAFKQRLTQAVQTALARAPGVEGGIWQTDLSSLAYAFPTYEGTGPKTDLPAAELGSIRQVNADAAHRESPTTIRQTTRSQVLVLHACPLQGPLANVTGWTMMRVFTGQGPAYNQLLVGLAVLTVTVLVSAIWLGTFLVSWSRKLARLEASLSMHDSKSGDLPTLPTTGERELDRLVDALNATGRRLDEERRRAVLAERLSAVGRLAAGVAHEIRNPIAAMRLKAENAILGDDERRKSALQSILQQIGRLDGLLRDLLTMTQRKQPAFADVDLRRFIDETADAHRELAATKDIVLSAKSRPVTSVAPKFDINQVRRAVDNLLINAIQNTPRGGAVTLDAERMDGRLVMRVADTGPGLPVEVRDKVFEPFVSTRPDGTGLGLAIVREVARAHGGDAHLVTSAAGAVFEIDLPWQPS